MGKLCAAIGATLFGTVGWYLAAPAGTFTAFVVSTIATGVGIYAGRRLAARYF